jgi:Transglycosylase SLT domain
MPAPFLACMALVASFYQLPPRVLPAIHLVEGGRPGMVSPNTNGSFDLGVIQVNTLWVEPLARRLRLPAETVRRRLIDDPCFNIATAGAILRLHLNESRGDPMRAIGNYHSRTPPRNQVYQVKLMDAAHRLFGPR